MPLLAPAALARSKQEALDALPADYYLPDVDPLAGELAMLPRMFTEADLEAVVEERSGVLEVFAATMLITLCISGPLEPAALLCLWVPMSLAQMAAVMFCQSSIERLCARVRRGAWPTYKI